MLKATTPRKYTAAAIADLEARLQEAEDTLQAIRDGSVDALVVKDRNQPQQIFTLQSADYMYRVLIESMSQGALAISEDNTIMYSNKQFSVITGQPLEQIMGHKISSFVHEDDIEVLQSILRNSSKNNRGPERTVRLLGDVHKEVMVSARILPGIADNAYMCLVVTDMTERKQAEHAKDEFISLASHQLRTPATGVKQYLGMLLEGYAGELSKDQRTFTQTAYDSNERQLAIINSILKTAQIDFGAYELKIISQNMEALISETLQQFEPMLSMRRQIVDCSYENNVCALVEPLEMSLVVSNLIENASKYSPEGERISIKVYRDSRHALVDVTDNGVGISPKDQNKVFEKFTRVDNVLSDTVSGSGLGLYWVKKIVELHEGEILLKSQLNVGSTFTIKLKAC